MNYNYFLKIKGMIKFSYLIYLCGKSEEFFKMLLIF